MTSNTQIQPNLRRSEPADPSKHSILTLPAEIRNTVYELLFRDNDLRFRDDEEMDMLLVGSLQFPRTLPPIFGIGLLSTCWQVHMEAIGLLYNGKTFVFRTGETCVDRVCRAAALWLTEIGTNARFVGNLIMQPDLQASNKRFVDALPLLRHLWNRPNSSLRVTFRSLRAGADADDALRLTKAFWLLELDTVLNIRKLSRFPRLLQRVLLDQSGRTGVLHQYQPCDPAVETLHFIVEEENIVPKDTKSRGSWDVVMSNHSICNHLQEFILPGGSITLDLKKEISTPGLRSLLSVSRALSSNILLDFQRIRTEALVSISDRSASPMLDQLSSLQRWLIAPPSDEGRSAWWRSPLTIVLRFDFPDFTNLRHLEFDVLPLIKATALHDPGTDIRITLPHCPERTRQEFTVPLRHLRREALAALIDFSFKFPMYNQSIGPQVWVDGNLVVKEASLVVYSNLVAMRINSPTRTNMIDIQIRRALADEERYRNEGVDSRSIYVQRYCSRFRSLKFDDLQPSCTKPIWFGPDGEEQVGFRPVLKRSNIG